MKHGFSFLGYIEALLPYLLILIFGIFFAGFLFKFFSNKKEKIWDKESKKLLEEAKSKTDKELHKEMILKNSYLNSIARLDEFLTKVYKQKKEIFELSALDAFLLVELFPFDIRKSNDGKYYLIDKEHFLFFLKLLKNGNQKFISDVELKKTKEKLLKKLLSFDENIVLDAKYVFDLILFDNIPNDNIEEQTFIKLSTAFKDKTNFKIVDKILESKNENKNNDDKNKEKNISIIKGGEKDYYLDLNTGKQYEVVKEKKDKEKNEKNREAALMENLILAISSQSEEIKKMFEVFMQNTIEKKGLTEEEIKKIILNNIDILEEKTQEQIKNFIKENDEHKQKEKNKQELISSESSFKDNEDNKENENNENNEDKIENFEIKTENILDKNNKESDFSINNIKNDLMEDFGFFNNEDNLPSIEKISKIKKEKKDNSAQDKVFFIIDDIKNNNFQIETTEKEKFLIDFFESLDENSIFFYPSYKKYLISLEKLINCFFEKKFEFKNIITEKKLLNDEKFLTEFLNIFSDYFDSKVFEVNDEKFLFFKNNLLKVRKNIKNKKIKILKDKK